MCENYSFAIYILPNQIQSLALKHSIDNFEEVEIVQVRFSMCTAMTQYIRWIDVAFGGGRGSYPM